VGAKPNGVGFHLGRCASFLSTSYH
jgi:hypothetical protein